MVRLNKHHLSKTQLEALFLQFVRTLQPKSSSATDAVLREILGPEERIMLAKRIAIIVLIIEGVSLYRIADRLKVSPATAQRIARGLEQGEYEHILSALGKSKKNYWEILETIDKILHFGGLLPHRHGLDRYRGLGYGK